MGAGAQAAKAVTLTVFLVLALSTASAASLTVNSDKTQWLNSGVDIQGSYACESGNGTVSIEYQDGSSYPVQASGGDFSLSDGAKGALNAGDYTAKVECDEGTATKTVSVNRMSLSIVNAENSVYKGTNFEFTVRNSVEGGSNIDFSDANSNFEAWFMGYGDIDATVISYNGNEADILVSVPENISSGTQRLKADLDYSDFTVETESRDINLRPSWSFNVSNVEPGQKLAHQNLDSLSFDLDVRNRDEPAAELTSDDFYVTVTEEVNGSTQTVYDRRNLMRADYNSAGSYSLSVDSIPEMDLGRYNFKVGLARDSGVEITNFTVSKYILFSGKITNSAGQPVDGDIRVSKDGFEEVIDVKENGEYSGQVLPGEYNFTLNFPAAKLSLEGVDLKSSRSTVQDGRAVGDIRYDEIPVGDVGKNMQGVTVFNSLAVWFGYPFDSGRMSLNYDTTRVNPSDLKVFECVGWNIDGVSCYQGSEWKDVGVKDSSIHPTVGAVSFPVRSYEQTGSSILLNGYMVVRNTQMNLNSVNIGSDRVKTEDGLTVSGKVTTPSEDPIGNADISIQVVDPNSGETISTKNVTSGGSGTFSGIVDVPSTVGEWDIRVEGNRKPYSGFSKEVSGAFSTYIDRSVSLDGPQTVNFVVGSDSSSEFTVINDGQTPINNVKIALSGFDRQWYSFSQNSWDTLQPGDSVQITLNTELPEDYCDGSCQEYKTVTVETTAEADGKINDLVQIQAQIRQEPTGNTNATQNSDNTDQTEQSLPDVGKMTGEFLEGRSDFNLALGMIMVFMLVLAAAVQKKKNGDDRSRPLSGMKSGNSTSAASSGSRPNRDEMRKSKPDVSNSDSGEEADEKEDDSEEPDEEKVDEKENEDSKEETVKASDEESSQEVDEVFECGTCGEEFDTESARELHEKAIHK